MNKSYLSVGLQKINYNKKFNIRCYSTTSNIKIIPIYILDNLNKDYINLHKDILKNKAGVYSFINTIDNKQYIGSAKDLYLRLNEHINGKKSNIRLQNAFKKHGLDKFQFRIFEYFTFDNFVINNYTLIDLETSYIGKFDFKELYNFKYIANSMLGYKHTEEAILKMVKRFKDKKSHPMFGVKHTKNALSYISKPGELNPMFGKKHSIKTINLISNKMSKYPLGVGIYDLNDNLIKKFKSKYLNKKLIYKNEFTFKPIS